MIIVFRQIWTLFYIYHPVSFTDLEHWKTVLFVENNIFQEEVFFGPSRVWKVHQCYLLYILSVPLFISPFISKLIMKKKPFMYVRFRCSYRKQPKGFCYKTPLQWDQISWEMHHIISELAHSCVLKVILHMIVYLSISCATTLILIGIIISSHSITRKMSLINFVSSVCRRKNKLVW